MSTDTRDALAALRAIVALDDDGVLTLVSDQAQSYHTDFVLALQNARAALATQPAQPSAQGEAVAWKRVPVEPTEAMVKAGEEADDDNIAATPYYAATAIYRAMLASAPAAPAQAEPSGNTPYDEGPFTLAAQPSAQGEAVAWRPGDPIYDDAYVRGVAVGFAADDIRRTTLLRIADRIEARASAPAAPAQRQEKP